MEEYYWLNKQSQKFLNSGYFEGDGRERVKVIAKQFLKYLKVYDNTNAQQYYERFLEYVSKGYYSFSSPIWSNYGVDKGLPISCNQSYISDSVESIVSAVAECSTMTRNGAGTSAYFGALRERGANISKGGQSCGPVSFIKLFNTSIEVIAQNNTRRGAFSAYLDIEHPDIKEFLEIGEEGSSINNISIGICISDEWMQSMIDGDSKKRIIWGRVIKKRIETGYPYLFFTDTVNNNKPSCYKKRNKKIHCSNLCSEIMLHSSETETVVCNLSSMNLVHFEEWKDTDAVEILTMFLDAVMEDYICKTNDMKYMEKANLFCKNNRALGIGVVGWSSLLQSKMIPFESMKAKQMNIQIFKHIKDASYEASTRLGKRLGVPKYCDKRRNVTTMAVAPTMSSAFIMGQISQSIEPINSNYFVKDLSKGKFTFKNPYLKTILIEHKQNTFDVWQDILLHGGSVQHLKFLTDQEKSVFKTFGEISQKEIIIQAANRQKYIDQGQSLNLMIPNDASAKDINKLIIFAWENKIKSLYYQRGVNPAQQLNRDINKCVSCEG